MGMLGCTVFSIPCGRALLTDSCGPCHGVTLDRCAHVRRLVKCRASIRMWYGSWILQAPLLQVRPSSYEHIGDVDASDSFGARASFDLNGWRARLRSGRTQIACLLGRKNWHKYITCVCVCVSTRTCAGHEVCVWEDKSSCPR